MKELNSSIDTNRETIELFLVSEPGTIELSDKQKELLQRWEFADEQIRKNEMKRETIAQLITMKFKISRASAYQDIVNAESIFASSTPLNKKYRIGLRIEYLERKIEELYDAGESLVAAMLEKSLSNYYKLYPEIAPVKSPKTIVFNIQNNTLPTPAMTVEEALREAGKIIDIKPEGLEDGAIE